MHICVDIKASPPGGYLHPQVSVDGDGQQGKDGALGEDQQQAGEEEARVERNVESEADDDGQRDHQHPDGNVGHRQGHDEGEGGVAESPVCAHHRHHQHVPQHGGHGYERLNGDVHHIHVLPVLDTRRGRHGCSPVLVYPSLRVEKSKLLPTTLGSIKGILGYEFSLAEGTACSPLEPLTQRFSIVMARRHHWASSAPHVAGDWTVSGTQ